MTLSEYVSREVTRTKKNKTTILKELAAESNVSLLTLQGVVRGATMRLYDKALAIQTATKGQVTVTELCEHAPAKQAKKTAKKKD